jgi:hypothetical protein
MVKVSNCQENIYFFLKLPIIRGMGTVYLLCELSNTERYKIGVTRRDVDKRIKECQTGNANPIHLVNKFESEHYKKVESWLHRRYHSCKVIEGGTEWFDLPAEDVIGFTKICEEVEGTIKYMIEHNHFFK